MTPTPEAIVVDLIDETRSQWISEAMEHLNTREREVIRGASSMRIKRLAEIGETFGATERIRQIEGKALSKLKLALADRGIEGGLMN